MSRAGRSQISAFAAWIKNRHLPWVFQRGWDKSSGVTHEKLNGDGSTAGLSYRRLTALARQLFVASGATRLELGDFGAQAGQLFHYLSGHFWRQAEGAWLFKTDLKGRAQDDTRNLYAYAFILLGLAEYFALTGDPLARRLMEETDQALQQDFYLDQGWYAAALPDAAGEACLLQNPHMHLLEAYLAIFMITSDPRYEPRIRDLLALAETKLFDPTRNILPERRAADGLYTVTEDHPIEPGHHFEWYWLLHEAARVLAQPVAAMADPLFTFGVAHGLDRVFGGVFDGIAPDGQVLRDSKRIWPQTEYIKALSVRARRQDGDDLQSALDSALEFLAQNYLRPDGGWRERLNRDLSVQDDGMPATTSYHLLTAYRAIHDLP